MLQFVLNNHCFDVKGMSKHYEGLMVLKNHCFDVKRLAVVMAVKGGSWWWKCKAHVRLLPHGERKGLFNFDSSLFLFIIILSFSCHSDSDKLCTRVVSVNFLDGNMIKRIKRG